MIFEKFDNVKLEKLIVDNGIIPNKNYLLATKNRNFIEGVFKLFINNIYNSIDASLQYLLIFDYDSIYITKISTGLLESVDEMEFTFRKFNHDEIESFNVTTEISKHIISWCFLGKQYAFEIDKPQGVYSFVTDNFNYLTEQNFNFK